MGLSLNYNQQKQKKRSSKKTVLFLAEGQNETFFLKHLQLLYWHSHLVHLSIRTSKKGTADGIVIEASKIGKFEKVSVVLDNDRPREMKKARREAKSKNIELIENTPCLEHTLLKILSDPDVKKLKNSTKCKKKFQSKYMDRKKRSDLNEYKNLFPKKLLNNSRKKVKELNRIISIMEKGK